LFNSNLIVLHVIQEEKLSEKTEQLLKSSIEHSFQKLREGVHPSIEARMEFHVLKGVVFERIVHMAIERDVNVIIAGAGSDWDDDQPRLSTIIEKLMRKNQVPLWVVKGADRMPARKILCPVDFSDASGRALQNAITLAAHLEAELTVQHVYTPLQIQSPRLQVDNELENEILKKRQNKEFNEFMSGFDMTAISHKRLINQGIPEKVIRTTISKGGYDLLVMGTTGRTGLSRILMGSVTEKVTREVPCSFITTKSQDIARTYFESNLGEIESYLNKASHYRKSGDIDKAIEFYTAGLKQFPDNIPLLNGLIGAYNDSGNQARADFFRDYAKEVVSRVWGEEYIKKLNLD
jgi:nucleotide-binding universal stress UspA family protein